MKEFKYASVKYVANKYHMKQVCGIEIEDGEVREGMFLGVSQYADADGMDTYLMVIDAQTGYVIEVAPTKVQFDTRRFV